MRVVRCAESLFLKPAAEMVGNLQIVQIGERCVRIAFEAQIREKDDFGIASVTVYGLDELPSSEA